MLSFAEMKSIIEQCSYKPEWAIALHGSPDTRPYVQLHVDGTCSISGKPVLWSSGKRYLSPWMRKQEIVGVVFDLIKAAEMHELHEWFRYKGASIYNPHLDPDALAELASRKESFVCRENAMSMEEPNGKTQ